jgi:S-DNA-T family DNA segregation ATPase FtsK/SpoIIIE
VDQSVIPNTLIAGAPGSGKSTLLKVMIENFIRNNCIVSVIDPKIVDFAYLKKRKGCNVCSDINEVPSVLDEYIERMNTIYQILESRGSNSVRENNINNHSKISYQVIIIDECADIFLSKKECINKVLCLAQKGRAAGISIILATQRPSSAILPGQIKANFTGRIGMRVSSEMESRIILNNPHAAHIFETGMAYYLDQSFSEPIYFRVTDNDFVQKEVVTKTFSFWENFMKLF